jgi:hypothetical protein
LTLSVFGVLQKSHTVIKRTRLIYKLIERRRRHERAFRVQTDGLGANSGWEYFMGVPYIARLQEIHGTPLLQLLQLILVVRRQRAVLLWQLTARSNFVCKFLAGVHDDVKTHEPRHSCPVRMADGHEVVLELIL